MQLGQETWKWALVLALLGVFLVVANHAYKSVNNAEDTFPPPDDYLKGDSFDIERGTVSGPGSNQPVEVPATVSMAIPEAPALPPVTAQPPAQTTAPTTDPTAAITTVPTPAAPATPVPTAPVASAGEPDWSNVKDPGQK